MAIMVECPNCGKQYSAPDAMAGKRVKCKGCGNVFNVAAEGDDFSDESLAALAALEKTHHDGAAADSAVNRAITPPPPTPGQYRGRTEEGDERDIPLAPLGVGRPNVRFTFPYAKEIDKWTPILLAAVFLPLVGLMTFKLDDQKVAWLTSVRLAVIALAYLALVFPLSLAGMRMAGKSQRYQLPRNAKWRAFATFAPAFFLTITLWLASGGRISGLVFGVLTGLLISGAAMVLVFRLRPNEIAGSVIRA